MKTVLTKEILETSKKSYQMRKGKASLVFSFLFGVFIFVVAIRKSFSITNFIFLFILIFGPLFYLMVWRKNRRGSDMANDDYLLVSNRVSFKEIDTDPDTLYTSCWLWFHRTAGGFRAKTVDGKLYDSLSLGDPCYLVLIKNRESAALSTEIVGIYPEASYELDEELQKKLSTDPAVIGKAEWTEKDLEIRTKGGSFSNAYKEEWRKTHLMEPQQTPERACDAK